jgi:hypothetical protein
MLEGLVQDIFLLLVAVAGGERLRKRNVLCVVFQAQKLPSKPKGDIQFDNLARPYCRSVHTVAR